VSRGALLEGMNEYTDNGINGLRGSEQREAEKSRRLRDILKVA
jgi:hypothetical protein